MSEFRWLFWLLIAALFAESWVRVGAQIYNQRRARRAANCGGCAPE